MEKESLDGLAGDLLYVFLSFRKNGLDPNYALQMTFLYAQLTAAAFVDKGKLITFAAPAVIPA